MTSAFCTSPAIWPLADAEFALADDLVFHDEDGTVVTVPGGTRSDGASIPRWLWSLVGHPLTGRYVYPAFLHDWECTVRAAIADTVHRRFYRALRSRGMHWLRAEVLWSAVKAFGPRWTVA